MCRSPPGGQSSLHVQTTLSVWGFLHRMIWAQVWLKFQITTQWVFSLSADGQLQSDNNWNKLSNPINCLFWHHSYIWLNRLPQNMVSHPYLIFRNKWDIKHFLFFLNFSYHCKMLYEPHCQWCWVKFTHAGHVILQLILYKLWSKMSLRAFQPYKLPILTSQLHLAQRATPKYGVIPLPYL